MSIYSYYTLESTGSPYTSMDDFGNASVGTVIIRNDGHRYTKNAKGVWERAGEADYFNISKLTIGDANGESAVVAGAGTIKYEDGSMFFSDGQTWNYLESKEGTWKYFMNPDRGFVFGGYKNSVAWSTVCRVNYSSDTTSLLGDIIGGVVSYKDGMSSKYYSYMLGVNKASTSHSYTSSDVDKMHHITETVTTTSSMLRSVNNRLAVVDEFNQLGYVGHGGSTRIDKLVFDTDTWVDTGVEAFSSGTGAYGGVHAENYGHFNGGNGTAYTVLAFNTVTVSNITGVSNIGATRGMVCDENYAWHFGGSNTGRMNIKVSYSTNTGTTAGSYPATFGSYFQEANNMGQPQNNTGYISGGYNGTMVNYGGKFNATTETTLRIASLDLIGHDGASSAATGWNYNGY
jgi:hypothetical protein